VEFVANKSDRGEGFVADFDAGWVDSSIDPCAHRQSLARGGGCDQVDDDFVADQWPASRNALQQNKGVRAIAVTAPERTDLLPGVPAMSETLAGYVVMQHFGLLTPAGTPADVVKKLADATKVALATHEVREKFVSLGMIPVSSSPAEFAKVIADDRTYWGPIIAGLGPKKN